MMKFLDDNVHVCTFSGKYFSKPKKISARHRKTKKHTIRQISLSSAIHTPPQLKGIMCRIFTSYILTNLAEWNVLHIIATVSVSLAANPIIFHLCIWRSSNHFAKSRCGIERLHSNSTVRFVLFFPNTLGKIQNGWMFDREQVLNQSPEVIDYHIHSYVNSTTAISDNTTHSTFKSSFQTNCW